MHIERVQVEEGFLRGLDLQLVSGLNVIIGARGTGKTSLIELIRYCLEAGAFTDDAKTRGYHQAVSILQGGAVTLTVRDSSGISTVTRGADGRAVSTALAPVPCTVLAQNEIEAVGLQASGRLHLVDRFRTDKHALDARRTELIATLKSMTSELSGLLNEGLKLNSQVEDLQDVADQLAAAQAEQRQMLESAQASATDTATLGRLQSIAQLLAAREELFNRTRASAGVVRTELDRLRGTANAAVEDWPAHAGPDDLLQPAREEMAAVVALLGQAGARLERIDSIVADLLQSNTTERTGLESESRQLRQALDTLQEGVGAATRKVNELQERQGQLNALTSLLADRRARFRALSAERALLYRDLDSVRDEIFDSRRAVAQRLTATLGPAIRVDVGRSDATDEYLAAVTAALKGSRLHYNTLGPQIVARISPYELVTAAESGSVDELAEALDIPQDRAAALVAALRQSPLADVVGAQIDDGVTLSLLDGKEYKDTKRLSIGQRCTAVLPLLLSQHGDVLVVDQPEDHLDNAFIASTLVTSLRQREPHDQFIFSSHNANIPVLGEADRVIVMESDGDRGVVATAGPLDDPAIIDAVSRIMEGGREAFEKRATFYGAASGA